jgi:hypothetical protein
MNLFVLKGKTVLSVFHVYLALKMKKGYWVELEVIWEEKLQYNAFSGLEKPIGSP